MDVKVSFVVDAGGEALPTESAFITITGVEVKDVAGFGLPKDFEKLGKLIAIMSFEAVKKRMTEAKVA